MAVKSASNWRRTNIILFGILLALNVVFCAYAIGMAMEDRSWHLLPEDTGPAVRLLILLIGTVLGWGLARSIVVSLIQGEVAVAASVPAAWNFAFFSALFFAFIAFTGVLHWALLLILLVTLLFFSIPAFWRLLGARTTGILLFVSLAAGIVAFAATKF